MTTKILIVEDHTLMSQGLEVMLSSAEGLEVAGVFGTAEDAVERITEGDIDVVLMDVKFGKNHMSGIDATREVKKRSPNTKVLILSMFTDPSTVAEAVKAGADGYLSKVASRESVDQAIRDVSEGLSVLDPNVTEGIFGRISGRNTDALNDKEQRVLQELAQGRSSREVAELLQVSEETIKVYLRGVFRKLGVHDRTEAVAEAFRRGLVD